jgi:hypothetical protein
MKNSIVISDIEFLTQQMVSSEFEKGNQLQLLGAFSFKFPACFAIDELI